ncbi:MAG: hypothetical protein AAF892_10135 [Cyanobacteria bacterium P01_D01_bin.71]
MHRRLADLGKTPTVQWLQKHRRFLGWLLLFAAFALAICGISIAVPLAFTGITIEALLVKRIRTKRGLVTRADQPLLYWLYVGVGAFATIYSLALLLVYSR